MDDSRELVLLCEDPDAPSGTFTHWVVTNISPQATGVAEAGMPDGGVAGRNGDAAHKIGLPPVTATRAPVT